MSEFEQLLGGVDRTTATRKMRQLIASGRAERTKKRVRTADGRIYPAMAYRLLAR